MGDWEQKSRARETLSLIGVFSLGSMFIAALVYLALGAVGLKEVAGVIAILLAALPAVLILVPCLYLVGASMWRTRTHLRRGVRGL